MRKIIKGLAKIIARFYWGYLKKAIDDHILDEKKSRFRYIGENTIFKGSGTIFYPECISVGSNVQIGDDSFIMAIGGVTIGDGTIISRNVCIHSGNHNFKSTKILPYDNTYLAKEINIGKGVWIGQNVNILPGVSIGDGAIIGMGTTISKNVGKGEIVVGSAQRSIGNRNLMNMDVILKNEMFFAKKYPN